MLYWIITEDSQKTPVTFIRWPRMAATFMTQQVNSLDKWLMILFLYQKVFEKHFSKQRCAWIRFFKNRQPLVSTWWRLMAFLRVSKDVPVLPAWTVLEDTLLLQTLFRRFSLSLLINCNLGSPLKIQVTWPNYASLLLNSVYSSFFGGISYHFYPSILWKSFLKII